MFTCNIKQMSLTGEGELICEASTIDLPCGRWPETITVVDGNKEHIFMRRHPDMNGDEIAGVNYISTNGIKMLVIND